MNERREVQVSRRLSLHLRHRPDLIGIDLDPAGWVEIDVLLRALVDHGIAVSRAELDEVVARNNKRRFAIDQAGTRIRANQGHSVSIELGLPVIPPPDVLFHGTHPGALAAIRREGLRPMGRHHVHLSADRETAERVGARRGQPVVLEIDAAAMVAAGQEFRRSANDVWLVDYVPPSWLAP